MDVGKRKEGRRREKKDREALLVIGRWLRPRLPPPYITATPLYLSVFSSLLSLLSLFWISDFSNSRSEASSFFFFFQKRTKMEQGNKKNSPLSASDVIQRETQARRGSSGARLFYLFPLSLSCSLSLSLLLLLLSLQFGEKGREFFLPGKVEARTEKSC